MCVCRHLHTHEMRYGVSLFIAAVVLCASILLVDAAKKGERASFPPSGKPLNAQTVELQHQKGPIAHGTDGKVHVPHGKHQPVDPERDLPKRHLTVYHQIEIPQSHLTPPRPVHHGCMYTKDGFWDAASAEPIRFVVNPTGSSLTADEVIDVFDSAMSIIRDAVPAFRRRVVFDHLPVDAAAVPAPSLHVAGTGMINLKNHQLSELHIAENRDGKPAYHRVKTGKPNQVNEIGFSPRAIYHEHAVVTAEVYVLKDRDTKEYQEVDIVLATDHDVAWRHYVGKAGDANYWGLHSPDSEFDALSTALWALGHAFGLGPTNAHTHTMHGVIARGSMHKRSLECGDVNGLRSIYGR